MGPRATRIALAIYGGLSTGAALIFFAVTSSAGTYPPVARYGGAMWIFVLSMIVTMPLVIPRVKARSATR